MPERRHWDSERPVRADKGTGSCRSQQLAETLAGFEIEAPEEDGTGQMSDVEVVEEESAALGDENDWSEDEDSDFKMGMFL